jgi:putative copper export protein
MHGVILLLHLLAATVWTGGHLILATVILPRALKQKSLTELMQFESAFEHIGVPALLIQAASGFWLAYLLMPNGGWFDLSNPIARPIALKLLLLALTIGLAVDARLRVIPKLSVQTLHALAWHIIAVTVIAVLFVATGVSFRTGWLY